MLKGKVGVYIMIPLNILIWGFFIYRIYSAFMENEIPDINNTVQTIKLDELKDSVDYKLSLNYKDPFLREGEKTKSHSNSGNSNSNNTELKVKVVKTPTLVVKAPNDIKYFGLVKNNTTGVSTALVSINGKSHLVKKGDVIDGLSIKNISNDAVEIKEGKNSITVSKN